MAKYETIDVIREGPVDWLTLNRPARLNALNATMVRELWEYFSQLQTDYSRRVVVMRGAGTSFCAGMDLKARNDPNEKISSGDGRSGPEPSLSDIVKKMRSCPQPIVALVHGAACGGGFVFALSSDIRIAGKSARMNVAFVKLGLSGCELGTSYFLPRILGLSVASELMMTGRFIHADRALATGLVSQVVEDEALEDAGREMVTELLLASPIGLRKTKETMNLAQRSNDLDAIITLEEHTQRACMQSPDFNEAITAFNEKRAPRFQG
jgi:enoyl-CoA hydratase/carnithine racemase